MYDVAAAVEEFLENAERLRDAGLWDAFVSQNKPVIDSLAAKLGLSDG